MNQLIHTTAGVRDIFGSEYERKSILMEKISSLFGLYGYKHIQTPSIEFYPVFDKDKGTIHSSQLYKIIDKEGHTLVLRPDFTPSIARAVSMYFSDEKLPLRLCYQGNVFLNNANYRGRLNESTEMGVELINYDEPEADAELIALSVEIMKGAGIQDFQISIGNVGIFNAIVSEAGIDEETVSEIRHLLSVRNQFGAVELIESPDVDERLKNALKELPNLFGNDSVLEKAEALTDNEEALGAVKRLKAVYEILKEYKCEKYVSFDLGMLSDFTYYTGIIFQAVTYGSGDAVIKGGRYNRFIEKFGKKAAAVGFTTLVDSILSALQRQKLLCEIPSDCTMVLYTKDCEKAAIRLAVSMREKGEKVSCVPAEENISKEEYMELALKTNCGRIVFVDEGGTKEERL
jgi:ATP phosphoribosyltransferase regulatory subunit